MEKIITALLIVVILGSCAPASAVLPTETSTQTPAPTSTATLTPTTTATATATSTPTPSPTATPDYANLTIEEKIALSLQYVEQANSYAGLVEVIPDVEDGEKYLSYWSPNWRGVWSNGLLGSWRSAHNTPAEELDKYGESLPPLALPGYEDAEGNLILVDPVTGRKTVFPKPKLPVIGEISLHSLVAMGQQSLAELVVNEIILRAKQNDELIKRAEAIRDQLMAVFLPGYRFGEQNTIYAALMGGGSTETMELPEAGRRYYGFATNQFLVPIFSPESGNFMFFLNIQQGGMVSIQIFDYYPVEAIVQANHQSFAKTYDSFGHRGMDSFAILIERKDVSLSHWEGGGDPLLQGNTGIGDVTVIDQILNAKTEREILDLLSQYRIIVSAATRIVRPHR